MKPSYLEVNSCTEGAATLRNGAHNIMKRHARLAGSNFMMPKDLECRGIDFFERPVWAPCTLPQLWFWVYVLRVYRSETVGKGKKYPNVPLSKE